ncbi:GcrA family cell cycle regulator [Bradyrhizobium sp. URHD0069]|uniref:GcrA family cell cycle regulator n=1 Tax=Bradyrhizobium sp. URHD0069 TaxID=1380355 RepID=UPI000496B29C|nr:GcrA family cell cycle regulator [Bradyrhizobium sp. URHD0069]
MTNNIHREEWTEERIALLKELREAGVQRGEIADRINKQTGSNFTRSAICGKIDRLFPAAHPKKTEEEKAATKRAQRDRDKKLARERRLERRLAAGLPVDMPRRAAKFSVNPGLKIVAFRPEDFRSANVHGVDALESHHCRFICNDDMSAPVFCGLPMLTNSKFSFCAGHHIICTGPGTASERAAA